MGKIISNGINYSGLINAQGVFIDTDNVIKDDFVFDDAEHTWVATEDCILSGRMIAVSSQQSAYITIDGVFIFITYDSSSGNGVCAYVKKGQTVGYRVKSYTATSIDMKAYGIQQGSHANVLLDYSTNEQYTGQHWIDGKPIYQKTWDFGSSGFEVGYDQWVDTDILSNGFDRIVGVEAIAPTKAVWGWVSATSDNTYVQLWQTRSTSIKIQYLTLKYTKASS